MPEMSSRTRARPQEPSSTEAQSLTRSAVAITRTRAAIASLVEAIEMKMEAVTLKCCVKDMVMEAAQASLPFVKPEKAVAESWHKLTRGGELTSVLASVQTHGMLLDESFKRYGNLTEDLRRTGLSVGALKAANKRLDALLQDGGLVRDIRELADTLQASSTTDTLTPPSLIDLVFGRATN